MKRIGWLGGAVLLISSAIAEEPPSAPAKEAEKPKLEVLETISGEQFEKMPKSTITLKDITPKETISLDEAVDMPNDI